jgi:VWFA-related protein
MSVRYAVKSAAVITLAGALGAGLAAQQLPVYRSTTSTVTVQVSVRRGNNVVTKLTAADFQVTDNGVPQTIDAVAIEDIPIDVTLFLDTSGSTAGKLDEMREDVQAIVKMLHEGDKFRLLTIGDSVYPSVPWLDAGTAVDANFGAVGGISLIQDALLIGLVHRPDTGRRHLIVGMTDRADCGSVIPARMLLDVAGRTEAVMHLVDYAGGGGSSTYRVRSCTPRARANGETVIEQAAIRTGGLLHRQTLLFRSSSIARTFRTILDDFRQSYVLRYTATGVQAKGWHAIGVTVPGMRGVTVRARQGYFGK